ncbi:MAG: DUF4340 domain-containing protein [Flammeovirgaceae bacterium]|nr:DUF4340 domain-containing protein [Flammeovirgaceae bacterium]
MFRGNSNVKLFGLLFILILTYVGIQLFGGKTRSKSFREVLVEFDSTKVSKILINKPDEKVELNKSGNAWIVNLKEGKKAEAMVNIVQNAMGELLRLKPGKVAARKPEKWKDFQVDSAGTRVEVYEGNEKKLDIVLGRFGMKNKQRQQFLTYVRLFEDEEVYTIDNFLGMSFPSTTAAFRNDKVIKVIKDSVTSLSFTYPMDSSYILTKMDNYWSIGSETADSTTVANLLRNVSNANSRNFVDDINTYDLKGNVFQLTMNAKEETIVVLKAFAHPTYNWVIHSSQNPETYFADSALVNKIFVGRSDF